MRLSESLHSERALGEVARGADWVMARFSASPKAKERPHWVASGVRLENFLPGLVVGFLLGLLVELPKRSGWNSKRVQPTTPSLSAKKNRGGGSRADFAPATGEELKMVFVVRQDLKMGAGKVASQCAHAAVGIYDELMKSQRQLLQKWEQCGQPKIVVTCKNQPEMNDLRTRAERAGLPTHTVADAGRTQVAAGSKTVLVIGPGTKSSVDSITRHL